MANNTFTVSRAQLIYGLCLPLAVIVGYFLADPMESSSMAVVVLVTGLLSVPVFMRGYHPLLVFSCNAAFVFGFLPGYPPMWIIMALIGALFMVLNRCVDGNRRILVGGPIAWSLICLVVVVVATALMTGGAGLRAMGSTTYGGKRYIFIACAVLAYFVVAAQPIPPARAKLYSGLFFLSGLTSVIGSLIFFMGDRFQEIYTFILPDVRLEIDSRMGNGMVRIGNIGPACVAICLYMLARYGARGIFDFRKPWRGTLVLGCLVAGTFGGFRSFLLFMVLVFLAAFVLEGLHRTRYVVVVAGLAFVGVLGLAGFATRLPLSVQRAISFLPIEVSPVAKQDAQDSLEWRLGMWKNLGPDVPRYLLKGKGYALNPGEIFMGFQSAARGMSTTADAFAYTGEYHNGPLSVLIPFGLWGALALGWFLIASLRQLYYNFANGDPTLRNINCALLACFIAHVIFFVFLVGALEKDLSLFTCLAGLGVSLNGTRPAKETAPAAELEPVLEYGS
jgi:hypothetical protein